MFTVNLIVLAVHELFGGKTGRNLIFVVFGGEGGGGLASRWNELPSIRSFDVATSHERGVFAAERNHLIRCLLGRRAMRALVGRGTVSHKRTVGDRCGAFSNF